MFRGKYGYKAEIGFAAILTPEHKHFEEEAE